MILGLGQGKYKMGLESLIVQMLKRISTLKVHRCQPERVLTAKAGTKQTTVVLDYKPLKKINSYEFI